MTSVVASQVFAQEVTTETSLFLGSDVGAGDSFGTAVALSGDVALIGAKDSESVGAAYVYRLVGGQWANEATLSPSDGASGDDFGISVSIDGDVAIIGANRDDDAGSSTGAAYVFRKGTSGWSQEAKLLASDMDNGDQFGYSVSIRGDKAIVGSYRDDDAGSSTGSAYVFSLEGGGWVQQAKLTASDAASGDRFGFSVSIDGNKAAVAAYMNDDAGSSSGSAYVFRSKGSAWIEEAKLVASDAASGDQLGRSISIDGDAIVVGASNADVGGLSNKGAAYVYRFSNGSWSQQTKLTDVAGDSSAQFGYSVSLKNDKILVGAIGDNGFDGTASIYNGEGGSWVHTHTLMPSVGYDNADQLGFSVAIDGDISLCGKWMNGVAHLYNFGDTTIPCDGDLDGNGSVSVQDVLNMIGVWGSADPIADLDGNGTVAVSDLLILIANWGPCP